LHTDDQSEDDGTELIKQPDLGQQVSSDHRTDRALSTSRARPSRTNISGNSGGVQPGELPVRQHDGFARRWRGVLRTAMTVFPCITFFTIVLLASASLPVDAAPPGQAGAAMAVNSTARSLPPGGFENELDVSASVVQRERIATDAAGQAQLLMLDGSFFTIGPGASVVLDEFY
jgi:hypothetical protein